MKYKLKINTRFTEKLVENIVSRYNIKSRKNDLEVAKMKLGLEILIINIRKFLIVNIIAGYLNLFKETLFISIVFGIIRTTAFGLHAKNSIVCTALTGTMFIGGAYLSYQVKFDNYIVFAIFIIIIFCLYKYAPADTENHPILKESVWLKLKNKTVLKAMFFMIIALIVKVHAIKSMIILAIVFNVVSILPITYELLNRRYNNYEEYEKSNY